MTGPDVPVVLELLAWRTRHGGWRARLRATGVEIVTATPVGTPGEAMDRALERLGEHAAAVPPMLRPRPGDAA